MRETDNCNECPPCIEYKEKQNNFNLEIILGFILTVAWIAGIVLAHGFWSTFFTIFFAPYSWYLVIQKILILIHFI